MRAYVLHGINQLILEEAPMPKPKEHEVIVKVKAAGICGSDIPRIYKTGTYSFPLIPGHEFCGIVTETGENANSKWVGKRVGIFPLIPCYACKQCVQKKYEMCRHYSYLGSRTNGGFAEYVAVPEDNLIELPAQVSDETAAMLEPMAVAVHAIRQSGVSNTDMVAVCGLGTIGLLICMFLLEKGIQNIYVIGNKDFQKEKIQELGILPENYCDSRTENVDEWLRQKTQGNGVQTFFECVGKNETISQAILNTAPAGTVQLVGNPASDITMDKNIYWKILRNQLTVKGSWNSSFLHSTEDDWHFVLDKLSEKRIHPEMVITQKYVFDELEQGLHIMRDKLSEYIKIIII